MVAGDCWLVQTLGQNIDDVLLPLAIGLSIHYLTVSVCDQEVLS